ncbi:MAG TPA: helix-turn-helix domain-containing protein, partial [Jiangellaceae bacterium]|nr:helix-turn-helix domain-containing protein [Jiangellaceae bacterium]
MTATAESTDPIYTPVQLRATPHSKEGGMSPQRSNRAILIEGTLRCLERLPPERVTARAIAEEAGANLASITYHFGSKDDLVTEAVISGLDRWLAEVGKVMTDLPPHALHDRFRQASDAIEASRQQ